MARSINQRCVAHVRGTNGVIVKVFMKIQRGGGREFYSLNAYKNCKLSISNLLLKLCGLYNLSILGLLMFNYDQTNISTTFLPRNERKQPSRTINNYKRRI